VKVDTRFDSGLSLFHKLKFNNHLIRCICILPKYLLLRKGGDLEAKSTRKVTSKSVVREERELKWKHNEPADKFLPADIFVSLCLFKDMSHETFPISVQSFLLNTSFDPQLDYYLSIA